MKMEIQNSDDLQVAIKQLEERNTAEKEELKNNFNAFTESLKPMNLIKSTLHNVTSSPGLAGNLLKATVGMGAGILSKKLLVGHSTGILQKLAGSAIKVGIAGLVSKKSEKIKYAGLKILTRILGKKRSPTVF